MELLLQSVDRAIDLLFHLHSEREARGVSDISRALAMPKSTVHRLLQALLRRGLVEQDAAGRYAPGSQLVALGLGAQERDPVVAVARSVLEEEASAIGETVFLTAPRGHSMIVLDKAEGAGFLRAAPRLGEEVPLHATAVGKLAFAFAPERFAIEGLGLERFTERTLRERGALRAEVDRVRRQGFAVNRGEWIDGLSVVAAPVLIESPGEDAPRFVAAVAVAAASQRLRALGPARLGRRTREAAHRIEARLGASSSARRKTPGAGRKPA
jgi:DNA-binding IclR family transcriptional regulator